MKRRDSRWRLLVQVLVLALVVAAVPLPSLAQEKSAPAGTPAIKASLQKAVAAVPLKPAPVRATTTQAGGATTGGKSFFKTPIGIAAIGVLAAGTGYAFYSASHDRIHSVVRKGQ